MAYLLPVLGHGPDDISDKTYECGTGMKNN